MNVAVDLACHQATAGHEVFFASSGGEYVDLLVRHAVSHSKVNQTLRAPGKTLMGVCSLFGLLLHNQPDIVHAHMVSGFLIAKAFQPLFRYRLVSTMHNEFQRSTTVMRYGDCVIAISRAVEAALKDRRFSSRTIALIPNGVIGSPRAQLHNPSEVSLHKPAIMTVAGLYPRKGILDLLRAFDSLSGKHQAAHLYVIGDGPQRQELENFACAMKSARNIHFEGFVAEPQTYLREADIFVLASHDEPFGLALIEAREHGCAVIGTAVGGISEVLDYGTAGLLVSPAHPQELAAAIDRLLSNESQMQFWKDAARNNLSQYTLERMGAETVSLYHRLLYM